MNPFSNPVYRNRVFWGFLLVWTGLVFHHYFSLKTAFDLSFLVSLHGAFSQADSQKLAANWLNFLKNLSCSLLIGFVLWRLGRRFFHWMRLDETNSALRFCLEMALGIIGANAFWLGLGLNRLWFGSLLWSTALALLGWALWDFSRSFLKVQKFPRVPMPGRFFLFLGLLGALSFALDLFQGLAPDVYFDALVYHLSTLQFWMFHHGVTDFYTNLYSYFPFGGELYFFSGFFFAGSEAAKLLNAFSAGLCGLAVAGWVAEETGMERGLLVWTMVLTLPLVSATVWTTQNDVLLAFFLILFLYAIIRWVQGSPSGPWVLAGGLLGGAALTVKYTAVVGVVLGLLSVIFVFRRGEPRVRSYGGYSRLGDHEDRPYLPSDLLLGRRKGFVLLTGLMFLSLAPWLLKNFAFTGNGFYPYLSSVFGGRALPAENMKALMADHEAVLNGPFSFRAWIVRLLGTDLNKTIAPLLFSFLPFLFLGGKKRLLTRYFLLLSVLLLVSGFLISHQLRLMIPAFVVCFMAMALVLGDIENRPAIYAWGGITALFAVLSLLSLGRLSVNYYQTQRVAFGTETRAEYLATHPSTASYDALAQAAGYLLPPEARLLVAGDARGLYYPRPFYTNSVFDEQILPRLAREEKDGAGIHKRLREMGIDVLVVSGEEGHRLAWQYPFDSLAPAEEEKLDGFIQHWTDPLFFHGLGGLYRLRNSTAGPRPPVPDLLKLLQSADKTN